MKNKSFEYRMYGLVPYNISDIQKAIQYGHAVVEYMVKFRDQYDLTKWAEEDKTFIILNGGTTNIGKFPGATGSGTLNQHLEILHQKGIRTAVFYEPDLGDQLTAVVFLVDERVFNKDKYPDFVPTNGLISDITRQPGYSDWVTSIGGVKNEFLRQFLKQFRLA